jgi:hypothetical protein
MVCLTVFLLPFARLTNISR